MERSPNADEAAAIVAVLALFQAEGIAAEAVVQKAMVPWQRAALVEGVGAKGIVQRHLEGGARWQS